MNQKKLAVGVGLAITNNKTEVINLINKHGGNLSRQTSKRKVYDLVKSFGKSNAKFTKELLQLLVKKYYLNPLDFHKSGDIDNSKYSSFLGITALGLNSAVGVVQGFFRRPETDQTAINTILEIEREKEKNEKENNAKYWVIGSVVLGLLTVTTIIIIKKS